MQAANDRPFADDRLGQLSSHREIVLSHQTELARCCYLLTSNLPKANQLAVSTLLDFFAHRDPNQAPEQQRVDILSSLARQYLREDDDDDADAQPAPIPFSPPIDQSQRYQVDDERSKLLAVLDRLAPIDRVALILRDYAHLDDEYVGRALDMPPYQLAERLPPIRQRLRMAVSVRDEVSTRSLLDQAAGATPRPQLWPLVAEPLAEQVQAQRERGKQITWAAAAGVAILLLLGGVWLFSGFSWLTGDDDSSGESAAFGTASAIGSENLPTSTPANTPTPLPPMSSLDIPQGSVPSSVMLTAGRTGVVGLASFRLDLATDELTEITDEQTQVVHQVISPNGRWLAMLLMNIQDPSALTLQLVETETNEILWTKDTATFDGQVEDIAFANGQLYVITRGEATSQIAALDPETGQINTGHFNVIDELWDAERLPQIGEIRLLPTPAGNQLWVSISARTSFLPLSDTPPTWPWVLASFSLPDLTLQASQEIVTEGTTGQPPDAYDLRDKLFTPDGEFLVTRDSYAQQLYFYSPFHDKRLVLNLRFTNLPGGQPDDLVFVPSNSGRYLYVIAMSRYEFAIVDLLARTVPRLATIDTGELPPWPVNQDSAAWVGPPEGLMSTDGAKLYLSTKWPQIDKPEEARINVIDITTWTIVDQWQVSGQVINLIPLEGGAKLLVSHMMPSQGTPSVLPISGFTIFDTASGEPIVQDRMMTDLDYPMGVNPTRIGVDSLFTLYRRSYGRSPSIDDQPSVDAEVESSLPRVRISARSSDTNLNMPFTVNVRVGDPAIGAPILQPQDGVRFDPQSIVTLTLSYPGGDTSDVLLVMQRNQEGVYQALATLPEAGFWDAQITFTPPEGQAWSIRIPAAINVRNTAPGTDGRSYRPSIEIQPEEPHASTPFTIRLRWFDVETRRLIPEGVELEGGTPSVTAQFFHSEYGVTNVELQATEHGVFAGEGQVSGAGRWHVVVTVQFEDGERIIVDGGMVYFAS